MWTTQHYAMMQIGQNKIKINFIFIYLKGSDKTHDDVDSESSSKILIKRFFILVMQVMWST